MEQYNVAKAIYFELVKVKLEAANLLPIVEVIIIMDLPIN
jgi:hypothetical protein